MRDQCFLFPYWSSSFDPSKTWIHYRVSLLSILVRLPAYSSASQSFPRLKTFWLFLFHCQTLYLVTWNWNPWASFPFLSDLLSLTIRLSKFASFSANLSHRSTINWTSSLFMESIILLSCFIFHQTFDLVPIWSYQFPLRFHL